MLSQPIILMMRDLSTRNLESAQVTQLVEGDAGTKLQAFGFHSFTLTLYLHVARVFTYRGNP